MDIPCVRDALNTIYRSNVSFRGVKFIITDGESAFKSSVVHEWLEKHDIQLILANTKQHKNSMSIIERWVGILSKRILERVNGISLENRRHNAKWVDVFREELFRLDNLNYVNKEPITIADLAKTAKVNSNIFKIGDEVHVRLNEPVKLKQ